MCTVIQFLILASYVINNKEIKTVTHEKREGQKGDRKGSWRVEKNTKLELIGDSLGKKNHSKV